MGESKHFCVKCLTELSMNLDAVLYAVDIDGSDEFHIHFILAN